MVWCLTNCVAWSSVLCYVVLCDVVVSFVVLQQCSSCCARLLFFTSQIVMCCGAVVVCGMVWCCHDWCMSLREYGIVSDVRKLPRFACGMNAG